MPYPIREQAWALLTEYNENPGLIKHGLAVEAAMRAYAEKTGENVEEWGVVGLLHDFDYEKYPTMEEHAIKGAEILRERGYPEEMIRAVQSHANHTGVPRDTLMAKTLYAVDELSGFIIAVALVRPNKRIADVKPKSVKNKMKDKAFARACNRDEIRAGAELLGSDFGEHVQTVIDALTGIAEELGLQGTD